MKPPLKSPEIKETNVDWKEVKLSANESPTHKHYFEWRDGECKCKNCPFGLLGVVDIKDGRPY